MRSLSTFSSCGASYFLTIIDDFKDVWLYVLIDEKEMSQTMKVFFSMVERQCNKQVKIVRTDNGTKFTYLKNYFLENGKICLNILYGTPQQNGQVERKHQHMSNVAGALRFQGCLPIDFWRKCCLRVGYLINRTPS